MSNTRVRGSGVYHYRMAIGNEMPERFQLQQYMLRGATGQGNSSTVRGRVMWPIKTLML